MLGTHKTKDYSVGEHATVPVGAIHRMENHTDKVAKILEVQTGSYLGEDDIVQYEDVYGRS